MSVRPWFHKLAEPARDEAIAGLRRGLAMGSATARRRRLVARPRRAVLAARPGRGSDLRDALDVPRQPRTQRDRVASPPARPTGPASARPSRSPTSSSPCATTRSPPRRWRDGPTVAIAYEPKVASLAADLAIPADRRGRPGARPDAGRDHHRRAPTVGCPRRPTRRRSRPCATGRGPRSAPRCSTESAAACAAARGGRPGPRGPRRWRPGRSSAGPRSGRRRHGSARTASMPAPIEPASAPT